MADESVIPLSVGDFVQQNVAASIAQQIELIVGQRAIFSRALTSCPSAAISVTATPIILIDHVIMVCHGRIGVAVDIDGEQVIRQGGIGALFFIKADREHTIIALEDDTMFVCLYAHRDPQGEVRQEFTGFEKAYT